MTRELLFRGKHKRTGKWVFGDLVQRPTRVYIFPRGDGDWQDNEVLPESVCQFTGKLDKNGKKIFEGDFLGRIYRGKLKVYGQVIYDQETNDFYDDEYGDFLGCYIGISMPEGWQDLEVIGNATDNPSLLEAK